MMEQRPVPASFFCTVSEEEFTDEFRAGFMAEWRRHGVRQMRATIVNGQYPESGYPHGVWLEGWTDENAKMLPFGEAEKPGGPIYPPLTAKEDGFWADRPHDCPGSDGEYHLGCGGVWDQTDHCNKCGAPTPDRNRNGEKPQALSAKHESDNG